MVLERASADELSFCGRRRSPRPLAIAGAVFGIMALLPLLAPGPLTLLRTFGAILIFTLSSTFVARSWARTKRVTVELSGRRELVGASGAHRSIDQALRYALVDADDPAAPGARYGVDLMFANGAVERLLEGPEPGRVLADLQRAREFLSLPVSRGWGLPLGAEPWELPAPKAMRDETRLGALDVSCDRWPGQRAAGLTVVVGALVIGILMAVMLIARVRRGNDVSALSLALSLGTIGTLLTAGAAVGTARSRVRANGQILVDEVTLGVAKRRIAVPRSAVVRAYQIGPTATPTHHVLLETTHGPLAIACTGADASRLEAALSPPLP
jgi:hypothetical protein